MNGALLPFFLGCLFTCCLTYGGADVSTLKKESCTDVTPQPTAQVIVPPSDQPTTVNVFVQNDINNSNSFQASNQNQNNPIFTLTNSPIFRPVFTFMNSVQHWISNKFEPVNQQLQKIDAGAIAQQGKLFYFEHKKKCIAGVIGLMYAGLVAYLWRGYRWINDDSRWNNWKQHMSIQELQLHSQKVLEADLITEIQRRYLNPKDPTDRITPLMLFMKDIDDEVQKVTRYLQLALPIYRCRLSRIFPINDQKIERAQEKKQRLSFIKHIFVSWAAQYNFEKM